MVTKKVIFDADPGIDDAVALTMALFEPQFEVLAITAVGGIVTPEQATRNVQATIEQLDPPKWPRIGAASPPDDGLPATAHQLYGPDGLGNANFQVAELVHRHQAEKVLCDEIRAAPEQVTIITFGPLTNLARAFARDPQLAAAIGQIIMVGGTYAAPGDATPAAEFNIYADPPAARAVLRASTTKTIVPLDITRQVLLAFDLLNELPDETTRAGRFLRKLLPHVFRTYRQEFGMEGIHLHSAVAVAAALHPELFEIEMAAVEVEIAGELTTGATIFDRRSVPEWRPNVGVVKTIDTLAVKDCIIRGLRAAGNASADA
jgi:inosine-uridine nucleoside N-ribohydrolase